VGRPKADIKPEQVAALARIGCTQEEIAAVLKCTPRTLRNRFKEEIRSGMDEMRASIRRWQYMKAKDGNVAMLIWLGKQYLGQKDRMEETHNAEVIEIERIAPKILE
jgi:predicted transcriptional regulator